MNVTGVGSWQTRRIPLSDGTKGTAETIGIIRQLVGEGVTHPLVRRTATDIVRAYQVPMHDRWGEARAIYDWVLKNIRYVPDPVGVGYGIEFMQPAAEYLASRAGDCDCINAILLPALLGSVGFETRAVTVMADAEDPENFSHIYLEVNIDGRWVALDAARPGAAFGRAPERYHGIARWPLTSAKRLLQGFSAKKRLLPRFGLGRSDIVPMPDGGDGGGGGGWGGVDWASVLQSVPAIETGTAQIISASQGRPVYPFTPGQPAYETPVMSTGPGFTVGGSASSTTMLILIIVGIGALVLLRR